MFLQKERLQFVVFCGRSVYKKKGEARNKNGLGRQNLWPQEECHCRRLPRAGQGEDQCGERFPCEPVLKSKSLQQLYLAGKVSSAGQAKAAFPPHLAGWQWRFHSETQACGTLCAGVLVLKLHLKQGKKNKADLYFLTINCRWILLPRCRRNSSEVCRRVTGY